MGDIFTTWFFVLLAVLLGLVGVLIYMRTRPKDEE